MKFFAVFCLIALAASVAAQVNEDLFFIDDFEIETPVIVILIPNGASFPIVDDAFTTGPDSQIIGTERDLQLTTQSGASNLVLTSGVAAGDFACATPNEASGFSLIQWDGVDGTMTLNPSGLGSVDFLRSNAFALRMFIESDLPSFIDVFVYSGSQGAVCQTTVNLPGGDQQDEYILNYSSFSNGCDFGNVGAVEIRVDMDDNIDVLISLFSVFAPVPTTPSASRTRTRTPTPTPSRTPSASDTCVCRCPIFVCEVFRLDDGDYYFYNFDYDFFFFNTAFYNFFGLPFFGFNQFFYFFNPYFFFGNFFNPVFFQNFFNNYFFDPYFFGNFFNGGYFDFGSYFFDIWYGIFFN